MADLHRRGVNLRKPPAYHRYSISGSGGPDWLRNDYEFIVCATHGGRLPWSDNKAMGKPPKFAPGGERSNRIKNGERIAKKFKNGKRPHTKSRADGSDEIQYYAPPNIVNPGNVIKCVVGGGQLGHKLAHENEAPFPEKLAEFFIRSFCPLGGLVVDPFSGSGTTVCVAEEWGRRGIGYDIRQSQVELGNRRAADVVFGRRALEHSTFNGVPINPADQFYTLADLDEGQNGIHLLPTKDALSTPGPDLLSVSN